MATASHAPIIIRWHQRWQDPPQVMNTNPISRRRAALAGFNDDDFVPPPPRISRSQFSRALLILPCGVLVVVFLPAVRFVSVDAGRAHAIKRNVTSKSSRDGEKRRRVLVVIRMERLRVQFIKSYDLLRLRPLNCSTRGCVCPAYPLDATRRRD